MATVIPNSHLAIPAAVLGELTQIPADTWFCVILDVPVNYRAWSVFFGQPWLVRPQAIYIAYAARLCNQIPLRYLPILGLLADDFQLRFFREKMRILALLTLDSAGQLINELRAVENTPILQRYSSDKKMTPNKLIVYDGLL